MSKAAFLLRYGDAKHITDALHNVYPGEYKGTDIEKSIDDNPQWNESHTKKVIEDGWRVGAKAISHPSTTSDILHHAIEDGNFHEARAAIVHPNATVEHHLKAVEHDKPDAIRTLFGGSKPISRSVYEKLSAHTNPLMRRIAADSFRTPDDILHKLTTDPESIIAKTAKKTLDFNKDVDAHFGN